MSAMAGTLGTTLFKTAKAGLGINSGTGCTLEVMSNDAAHAVTVSGYREALETAGVPVWRIPEADVVDRGNGYVTAIFQGDNYLTRFELNDLLHGSGWKVAGYAASCDPETQAHMCSELWTKHVTSTKHEKSKKHDRNRKYEAL